MNREDRAIGALLGFAAGDALGATTEFMTPEAIEATLGRHTEITGGGLLKWKPGQGTDDSDLVFVLARAYADGYSLRYVADSYLEWLEAGPKDVGGTTRAALTHYRVTRNPKTSGRKAMTKTSAGNGSLMCALPTGLVPQNRSTRSIRAAELSRITHWDKRCVDSCIAYVNIVAHLMNGMSPRDAVDEANVSLTKSVEDVLDRAPYMEFGDISPEGYVLRTLEVAVWAVCQEDSIENLLIDIVNLGDDSDTNAAIAGGLLGARDGAEAVPERWVRKLQYRDEAIALGRILTRS